MNRAYRRWKAKHVARRERSIPPIQRDVQVSMDEFRELAMRAGFSLEQLGEDGDGPNNPPTKET